MLEKLDADARRAIVVAHDEAQAAGLEMIGPLHLLIGAVTVRPTSGLSPEMIRRADDRGEPPVPLTPKEARELGRSLRRRGLDRLQAADLVHRIQQQRALGPVELTPEARAVVEHVAARSGSVEELIAALLAMPDVAARLAEPGGGTLDG